MNLDKLSIDSYVTYANAANIRSTLNGKDGLKPVHRRILYTLLKEKALHNKDLKGSQAIVGTVLGKWHPHGDGAVYDAAVRMSQDFKMRYPLVYIKGNNGDLSDPKAYAASRYTKMKLTPLGELMMTGIESSSVDFEENYDGTLMEPSYLTSVVPNVLINGGMGIGVGNSCSLLPHNLNEVCDAIIAYVDDYKITTEDLMKHIKGPDFPTGGVITNQADLLNIYKNGKGTVRVRAKYKLETVLSKTHIVITEVPYMVSIEDKIIKPIQELVLEGYENIDDLINNTGENGTEIRIVLKKGVNVNKTLAYLFDHTGMSNTISMNNNLITDGKYDNYSLKGIIKLYIEHRHDVIIRIAKHKKAKAEKKLHITKGLLKAIVQIDEVVNIIKSSKSKADAAKNLKELLEIDDEQVKAILDMKLGRLTGLEVEALKEEISNLKEEILNQSRIINNTLTRNGMIKNQLEALKTYGDKRKTKLDNNNISNLIEDEDVVVILTEDDYIAAVSVNEVPQGKKGKKPLQLTKSRIVDFVKTNTKENLLCFTTEGRMYNIPVNLIDIDKYDSVTGDHISNVADVQGKIIKITKLEEASHITFVTAGGRIKKSSTSIYKGFKKSVQAVKLDNNDSLIGVYFTNDDQNIMMLGDKDKVAHVNLSNINSTGRATKGVIGIKANQVLASAVTAGEEDLILTYTKEGYGKLTKASEFTLTNRGAAGISVHKNTIGLVNTSNYSNIMVIDGNNKSNRIDLDELSVKSRTSKGTKISKNSITKILAL